MPARLDVVALRHCLLAVVLMLCMVAATLVLLNTRTAHSGGRPSVSSAPLDGLRHRAAGGDWDANRSLTRLLLERYEANHETEDLFEAMVWLEMDWDDPTVEHSNLQARIFQRYCGHAVVRWHWLCNPGE